jgi:hypothetical protein
MCSLGSLTNNPFISCDVISLLQKYMIFFVPLLLRKKYVDHMTALLKERFGDCYFSSSYPYDFGT